MVLPTSCCFCLEGHCQGSLREALVKEFMEAHASGFQALVETEVFIPSAKWDSQSPREMQHPACSQAAVTGQSSGLSRAQDIALPALIWGTWRLS